MRFLQIVFWEEAGVSMRRIDDREGLPDAHVGSDQPSAATSRRTPVMMVDAIMEELALQNVDLESVTLEEMKRLFTDACRDA